LCIYYLKIDPQNPSTPAGTLAEDMIRFVKVINIRQELFRFASNFGHSLTVCKGQACRFKDSNTQITDRFAIDTACPKANNDKRCRLTDHVTPNFHLGHIQRVLPEMVFKIKKGIKPLPKARKDDIFMKNDLKGGKILGF
jgi:hypothetical protein